MDELNCRVNNVLSDIADYEEIQATCEKVQKEYDIEIFGNEDEEFYDFDGVTLCDICNQDSYDCDTLGFCPRQ